ncbi:MAG: PAS domain-containing protein [Pseudomonadota bacterium]
MATIWKDGSPPSTGAAPGELPAAGAPAPDCACAPAQLAGFSGQYDLFPGVLDDAAWCRDSSGEGPRPAWRGRRDAPAQEASYRNLVEQVPAITYVAPLAREGAALLYISPQVCVLGYSPAQWIKEPGLHERLMHPEDRARASAAIRASRAAGAPLCIEYRLVDKQGEAIWYRDEAQALFDDSGKPAFIHGILVDVTQHKLAEMALAQTQDRLRALASRQESIIEVERQRIALEIHDELGGLLSGIKSCIGVAMLHMTSRGLQSEPLLADASALIGQAIATVSKVATELRPSILDHLGVWAALEWQVKHVARLSAICCECRIDPALHELELGRDCQLMLFRVTQEALTNVVRHAAATKVVVLAQRQPDHLALSVTDDGLGMAADRLAGSGSWGILGMKERAGHLGGRLDISSAPGQGTTLRLTLPLEKRDGR